MTRPIRKTSMFPAPRKMNPYPLKDRRITGKPREWCGRNLLKQSNPSPAVKLKLLLLHSVNHQILPVLFVKFFSYQSSHFLFYYHHPIISCMDYSLVPDKLVFMHKHMPLPVLPMHPTCQAKQDYHTHP